MLLALNELAQLRTGIFLRARRDVLGVNSPMLEVIPGRVEDLPVEFLGGFAGWAQMDEDHGVEAVLESAPI